MNAGCAAARQRSR